LNKIIIINIIIIMTTMPVFYSSNISVFNKL